MCGIAGVTAPGGGLTDEATARMCAATVHRGPDDGGIYRSEDGCCVLGNRRLAVIDLTPAGHMPMATEGGRFWITYNGEVYNFADLRQELEGRGHRFRSRSDTEVILRSYMEWGEACVERLNGMFAFALWDARERTLFLARDRFGIKPLYYTLAGDQLAFCSEIRGLLAAGLAGRRAEMGAIAGYLMLGSVPDDRTIVSGVHSLPPAHCALFRDGRLTLRRYWSHRDALLEAEPLAGKEAGEAVREGLKGAVARQMVSDAPLGLFLSGGMDSTTLAAMTRALGRDGVRSVSIVFDEEEFDEAEGARAVAERFGLDHMEVPVTSADVSAQLDSAISAMDQPSADAINTYFVSWAARRAGLTVALSGLGADELFGGYPSFQALRPVRRAMESIRRIPGHETLLPLAARVPGLPYRVRKLLAWTDGSASPHSGYAAIRGLSSPREVSDFLDFSPPFDSEDYMRERVDVAGLNDTEAASLLESRLYMHNQLLRDTDAMSMAHSLEVRVPYLDDAVVGLAARCRGSLDQGHKPALAAARAIYFPIGEDDRPKQGFSFPFERWLAGPLLADVERSGGGTDGVRAPALRSLQGEYRAGRRHWSALWAPVVLNRWLQLHDIAVEA